MRITAIIIEGDSGTEYDVTIGSKGTAHCSCPAFRYGEGKPCKHIIYASTRVES